jgi:DNA invertase Pin-like site-specific DNA recombinase
MPQPRFITYARVSTQRQGESGLGLDAQRYAVAQYLGANGCHVVGEFVEVESGRKSNRPELAKALAACRMYGATLVVAKLDRLARNAAFLLTLRDSGVEFVCADMPQATRLTIGILAVVAEAEAEAISSRVKAAIAAAKRRGVSRPMNLTQQARLKGVRVSSARRKAAARERAAALTPTVRELQAAGVRSLRAIAAGLNARGIPGSRGGRWASNQVWKLLRLIDIKPTLDDALALIRVELQHRGSHRARNLKIYEDRLAGSTLRSLAVEHGLTIERIRQLCNLEQRRRRRKPRAQGRRHSSTGEIDLRTSLEELLMGKP